MVRRSARRTRTRTSEEHAGGHEPRAAETNLRYGSSSSGHTPLLKKSSRGRRVWLLLMSRWFPPKIKLVQRPGWMMRSFGSRRRLLDSPMVEAILRAHVAEHAASTCVDAPATFTREFPLSRRSAAPGAYTLSLRSSSTPRYLCQILSPSATTTSLGAFNDARGIASFLLSELLLFIFFPSWVPIERACGNKKKGFARSSEPSCPRNYGLFLFFSMKRDKSLKRRKGQSCVTLRAAEYRWTRIQIFTRCGDERRRKGGQ